MHVSDEISDQRVAIEADIHNTITRLHETLDVRKTELIHQLHQLTQAKLKKPCSTERPDRDHPGTAEQLSPLYQGEPQDRQSG